MDHSLNSEVSKNDTYAPAPLDQLYRDDFSVNLGIFAIFVTHRDGVLNLKVRLGFDFLKHEWEATINFLNPTVTLTFADSKLLSASITLSIDDRTGVFSAKANWSTIFWSDSAEIRLSILAPFQFGLQAIGVALEGVKKYAAEIAKFGVGHNVVSAVCNQINEKATAAGINPDDVYGFMREYPTMAKGILNNFSGASSTDLKQIGSLSAADLELGMAAIVRDKRIQQVYPGIEKKFQFSAETIERLEAIPEKETGDLSDASENKVAEYIKEILVGLAGWIAITVSALGIMITLFVGFLGAAAVTGPAVVILVPVLAVLIVVLGPICFLSWLAATVSIIAYLIIDGYLKFSPSASQLQYVSATEMLGTAG